jgi:hypothetical protein
VKKKNCGSPKSSAALALKSGPEGGQGAAGLREGEGETEGVGVCDGEGEGEAVREEVGDSDVVEVVEDRKVGVVVGLRVREGVAVAVPVCEGVTVAVLVCEGVAVAVPDREGVTVPERVGVGLLDTCIKVQGMEAACQSGPLRGSGLFQYVLSLSCTRSPARVLT